MAIVPRIVRLLGMEGDRKRDKSLSGVMIIDVGRDVDVDQGSTHYPEQKRSQEFDHFGIGANWR